MITLAIRYLLARRKQTILMLMGIFFGSMAYVAISGFMLGFQEYLVEQLIDNNAHIRIRAREEFLTETSLNEAFYKKQYTHIFWEAPPSGRKDSAVVENPQSWYQRLKQDPRVTAFSPQLTAAVLFRSGKTIVPSTVIGCEAAQQVKVTTLPQYMIKGKFEDIGAGGNRLVIGDELQKKLGIDMYQTVMVSLGNSAPIPFKIVGVFKTGVSITDTLAYGALPDVQKVNQTLNKVNEISVKLKNYQIAHDLADTWSTLGSEKVESWDVVNANIFSIFNIQNGIRYLSIGSIMIVACFGIYNVLNMTVLQKRKDIAILRSMGYSTKDVIFLFFSQGLILGVLGACPGLLCGFLFGRFLETVPFAGGPLGSGTGHFVISFDPKIYIYAAVLSLLSATIASVLPARAAGKLMPIEVIREGVD